MHSIFYFITYYYNATKIFKIQEKNNNQKGGVVEQNDIYDLSMNEILDNTFFGPCVQ